MTAAINTTKRNILVGVSMILYNTSIWKDLNQIEFFYPNYNDEPKRPLFQEIKKYCDVKILDAMKFNYLSENNLNSISYFDCIEFPKKIISFLLLSEFLAKYLAWCWVFPRNPLLETIKWGQKIVQSHWNEKDWKDLRPTLKKIMFNVVWKKKLKTVWKDLFKHCIKRNCVQHCSKK